MNSQCIIYFTIQHIIYIMIIVTFDTPNIMDGYSGVISGLGAYERMDRSQECY